MPVRQDVTGLTIILVEPSQTRLRAALGIALSHVALDGAAQLFLDTAAVPLLRRPIAGADDAAQKAGGMPGLAALVDEALDAGIAIALCQAGVAMARTTMADYDPRVTAGGMIGLLAALGKDRLIVM